MSSQNIPPPPQYPNYNNIDITESHLSKENSVMENSVIYISDGGSPNYKNNRKNGYQHNTHQILPNLVNSINCTYQNLPPKSPKSNYLNMLNNGESVQQNSQWRQSEPINEPNCQQYNQVPNNLFNKPSQQYWMTRPREDFDEDNTFRERHGNVNLSATKTRSHPNLMNDYVNLAGTENILNDILYSRNNRPYIPATNDSNKNCTFKPYPMNSEQYNTVTGPNIASPEMFRNNIQTYPSQGLTEYTTNQDNSSAEASRLVNLLLEENKRLRAKLRQSDSRLESVDQLERKMHNLEILFEELLTSQRRQRLLDLQLQQASLSNYIVKNVGQNELGSATTTTATTFSTGGATSSSDNNRPVDLRKTPVFSSQNIIPSSPIITQKLTEDSPGERSLGFGCRQSKSEATKRHCNDQERYVMENDSPEQRHASPLYDPEFITSQAQTIKTPDDDFCQILKQTIRSVNMASPPHSYRLRLTQRTPSPGSYYPRSTTTSPLAAPIVNMTSS